jgi:hypothetical protein
MLMQEAAKTGVEPWLFLHQRMKRLIDAGDPKSLKEATEIGIQLIAVFEAKAFDSERHD